MKLFFDIFWRGLLLLSTLFILSNVLVDDSLLLGNVFYLLLICAGIALFGAFFFETLLSTIRSKRITSLFIHFLNIVVIYLFLTSVFVPSDFGLIDGMENIRTFTKLHYLKDVIKVMAVFTGSSLLYVYALKKKVPLIKTVAVLVFGASFGWSMVHYVNKDQLKALTSWDMLGKDRNVIFILADGLQGSFVASVLAEAPDLAAKYADFTFYDKALSPHVYTSFALPAILSGSTRYHDEYVDTSDIFAAAKKDNFIMTAKHNGFETVELPNAFIQEYVVDTNNGYILPGSDNKSLGQMFELGVTRTMPLFVSRLYFESKGDYLYYPTKDRDFTFWKLFPNKISLGTSNNVLLFQHSMISHLPVYFDTDGRIVQVREPNYRQTLDEVMFVLDSYATLFTRLKQLGLWDESLIIIAADHGSFYGFPEDVMDFKGESLYGMGAYNPAVLIKYPGNKGEIMINSTVISTTDLRAIIEAYVMNAGADFETCCISSQPRTIYTTTYQDKKDMGYYYSMKSYQKMEVVGGVESLQEKFLDMGNADDDKD